MAGANARCSVLIAAHRIALALLFVTAADASAAPLVEEAPTAGYRAPRFDAHTLTGEPFSLSGLEGRVVLLNFWATWCGPCRAEIPDLVKLQSAFPATAFTVIGIAEDLDVADVEAFLGEQPVNYPVLLDTEREISKRYRVRGLPASFIIDRRGVVTEVILGPRDWATAEWLEKIKKFR